MAHGIYVTEQATGVATPVVAESGIPFVIGTSPIQAAENPAAVGVPVMVESWNDAVDQFGYSDTWSNYTLCEFMYSHFKLYGCSPVIFVNLLNPASHKSSEAAADKTVTDHKVKLPIEAINDANLVVKAAGGAGTAYTKDTDYSVFYDGEYCVVELISTSAHYSEASLNIAYNKVTPASITATEVSTGLEAVELCATTVDVVPDMICAPGFAQNATLAATMAAKANNINGLFKAKAMIDIDCSATGAQTAAAAVTKKGTDSLTDKAMIVCWPMAKSGDHTFHMSSLVAGAIAATDTDNGGCPYESPSNKALKVTGLCVADGTEINVTKLQADTLNNAGIVTGLSFINGWTVWGNYDGAYPASTDVKNYFIPVSRMFNWAGNTLVKTFWSKLDRPMTRRLIDSIVDTANIWLNGLTGSGYILGGRVEFLDAENPLTSLMAGKIKLHIYMTPPVPCQEIDFVLEYDADYVTSALQS